ncbi:MAG: helix-turn-helix domain-containing protein [Pseudomonadota bacterium]
MANPFEPNRPLPPIAVAPDEAARLAGVGRTTLYAALAKGDLPSIKIGTRRLIRVDAIREWLARNETGPKA